MSAQKSHTGRSSGDGSMKYSVPPPARPSSTYSRGTPSTCRSRNRNVTVSAAAQYTPSVRKVSRGWRSRSGRSRSYSRAMDIPSRMDRPKVASWTEISLPISAEQAAQQAAPPSVILLVGDGVHPAVHVELPAL